ncbi:hypothetical protein ACE5I6_14645 [Yersinia ruckeri]|uniref:hypothetical protein n=1 Tax=Yersinia ruckeri TaxID=29486 RepID=UPI00290D9BAA|nr:hypothetical protein [Yersinia ruckeri]ELM3748414.1 hypothetical protein [Yersinia ruckeri]
MTELFQYIPKEITAQVSAPKMRYRNAGQLAVGSWQLAVGSWQLAVGSWQLAVGSWQLKNRKPSVKKEGLRAIL